MIHYTPADYKKYVFAKATVRMRRIEGIIDASMTSMAFSEVINDLGFQFEVLHDWRWSRWRRRRHRFAPRVAITTSSSRSPTWSSAQRNWFSAASSHLCRSRRHPRHSLEA